jgi:hypothetical protein
MATPGFIRYKAGFKYQLAEDYICNIGIYPEHDIEAKWVSLTTSGVMILREGFAWDGPSGPTIDRKENMRGSAEHDAGYRLIRYGLLPVNYREKFDDRIRACWIEDGMWEWVANAEVALLKRFGAGAARPSGEPQIKQAP